MEVSGLFVDNYIPEATYQLTPLEKNIIDDLVGKYNLTQKELAEHLGMHAQNLSTIKLKLLADNIIYPRFEIRNFLPLGCLLWCSSSSEKPFKVLIPVLEKLPYSNISPVENHRLPENSEIICFLYLDDLLYRNLISFLSKLLDNHQIDDFQIGINIESYFGMATVRKILEENQSE
jgi:hypothetical protein